VSDTFGAREAGRPERFKNLGLCASRASVTAALAELGLELELSSSRAVACSNEGPNGSWSPNQSS